MKSIHNSSGASQKVDETLSPEWKKYNKQIQDIEELYKLLAKLPKGTLESVVRGSSLFELESESSRDGASKRAREESLSDLAQAEPPKKRRKTELDKLMINGERTLIFNETELPRRSERLKKEALNDSGQDTPLQKNKKRG
ncbi:hypothetical protein CC99x_006260 [Candidatus Berkiella cookevillensis]|uniref:Uncharacterized protein n=1 Tax=Candidatus Berkiella cookevillensis TaxID=437022 RepID=A0A0Q9YH52_9GAMM|nr:hypothetical protein [Candidatus Berkiella cookevillensis]MCS5708509.1 hypothetical protein [Candidatus Berkiella cookevillensis]